MQNTGPVVSRRNALLGAAALAVLGTAASACGPKPPPPELHDLEAQRDQAQKDSDMAAAAAIGADPSYAPALTVVAAERAAHAKALAEEIARAAGTTPPPPSPSSPTSPDPSTAPAPPSPAEVSAALRRSADSTAQLATKLSGHRAGLLGAISASCAASVAVPLAARQPAS